MVDRLSPLDVSFLYLEESTTPMHVGGVVVFQAPEDGFDHDRLVHLIEERIALVPRYRQKVRWVPGRLANPVWVDDEEFDVGYHVRRSALPRPGTDAQLRDLVGRIMARPLDRSRPLWEMYLVEGLSDGRFVILTKTHHAMVDGAGAIDIGQVILDVTPEPQRAAAEHWSPRREPTDVDLIGAALSEVLRSPAAAVEAVRFGAGDLRDTAERLGRRAVGIASTVMTMARPPASNPLNAPIGEARRFGMAAMSLDDFKAIRRAHGGTVNDVVLAVVAGALREWMMTRGESVSSRTSVRALVPVSVRGGEETSGNHIAAFLVDLPVGEPQPVVRLHRVSYEMEQLKSTGQMIGAQALVGIAGFAPPTLHSLGARTANGWSRRMFNLVVTNVPGPQFPLYAGGARMLGAYPVVPLAKGQAVSIGLTSYDGGVYFGLNADRDAMPDVDVLSECIETSLAELLETVPDRPRRTRPHPAPDVPQTERPVKRTSPASARPKRAAKPAPVVDAVPTPVLAPQPKPQREKETEPEAENPGEAEPASRAVGGDDLLSPVRPRQVASAPSRGLVPRGGNEIKKQPVIRRPTESDST
jgi:diacylglycerol O-acyltransferase / wax synthase